VVRELDADGRNGAGRRTRRRGKGIPILRRKGMVSEEAVKIPFWARDSKKDEWLVVLIERINAELAYKPNMSLAEFAKGLDNTLTNVTFDMIKRTVDAQFDKE
jgi:hypothetical protein